MSGRQLAPENDEQAIFVEGLTDWKFIDNRKCSVADWIRSHLPSSTSASICVAYLNPSGFKTIEDELEHFLNKGASFSIISSEKISKTDAEFLLRLADRYPQIQANIYPTKLTFMHSKVYLLEEDDKAHVLAGSSNLTLGGLETNIESNLAGSFSSAHEMVRQWRENFDIIWTQGIAPDEMIDRLHKPAVREGGLNMNVQKQATEHPLKVGTTVLVHGQRSRILAVEDIRSSRFRYEILLEASGQAKKWVTLPTEIRPWLGPLNVALSKQLSSPLEYDLRTESLRVSLAYEYDLRYILALLNCSGLVAKFLSQEKRDRYDLTPDAIRQLPIRRINFTTPKAQREQMVEHRVRTFINNTSRPRTGVASYRL